MNKNKKEVRQWTETQKMWASIKDINKLWISKKKNIQKIMDTNLPSLFENINLHIKKASKLQAK